MRFCLVAVLLLSGCSSSAYLHPQLPEPVARMVAQSNADMLNGWVNESTGASMGFITPRAFNVYTYDYEGVEKGSIVVRKLHGHEVEHRVIGGNAERGWITKGDTNPQPDAGRMTRDNYIGTYLFPIPYK